MIGVHLLVTIASREHTNQTRTSLQVAKVAAVRHIPWRIVVLNHYATLKYVVTLSSP
jgi:hypothetical protein